MCLNRTDYNIRREILHRMEKNVIKLKLMRGSVTFMCSLRPAWLWGEEGGRTCVTVADAFYASGASLDPARGALDMSTPAVLGQVQSSHASSVSHPPRARSSFIFPPQSFCSVLRTSPEWRQKTREQDGVSKGVRWEPSGLALDVFCLGLAVSWCVFQS